MNNLGEPNEGEDTHEIQIEGWNEIKHKSNENGMYREVYNPVDGALYKG